MSTRSPSTTAPPGNAVRIMAIAGSLRGASYNRLLLKAAAALAPDDVEVQIFDDLASIPLFDEDLEQSTADQLAPVQELRQRVRSADGLLLSTPEYNQSIPGVLKNAIDWLSRGGGDSVLNGKPVAVIGITMGSSGTRIAQSNLRHVLFATESLVLPAPSLFIGGAADRFDDRGMLVDARSAAALKKLLDSFRDWIGKVAPRELEVR